MKIKFKLRLHRIINSRIIRYLSFLLLLACIIHYELSCLYKETSFDYLTSESNESDAFRAFKTGNNGLQEVQKFAKKNDLDFVDSFTVLMILNDFDLSDFKAKDITKKEYNRALKYLKKNKPDEYLEILDTYYTIIGDIEYFPVPASKYNDAATISYEDSWGAERTYGGERSHEGTDIMADNNLRGYFPVVSMTDGTVVNLGWLELGGYRIGIRSEKGAYLYYAHLYSYADGLKEGDTIKAGQLIGFMGDSGYSKVEGTTGNFAVHLHVGIYIETDNQEELSINPYSILKYLENKKLTYNYH